MGKKGMNDLISREALIKHFGGHVRAAKDDRDFSALDTWRKALFDVQDAPAVDAEPVRHERWNKNGRCTGCGNHAPYWPMAITYHLSHYCPNCGALMEAEVKA